MASSKCSLVSNNRTVLCLVGITIVYQIVYQVIMRRALIDSENSEALCDSSLVATSPQCVEAQLFQSWKHADKEFHHDLLQKVTDNGVSAGAKPNSSSVGHMVPDEVPHQVPSEGKMENSSTHPSDGLPGRADRHARWQAEFDKLYNETLASIRSDNSSAAWRNKITAEETRFDEWNEQLVSTQRAHIQDRADKFDKIYNDTMASLENRSALTPWAAGIEQFLRSVSQSSTSSIEVEHEIGQDEPLFKEIHRFGRTLCQSSEHHASAQCGYFLDSSSDSATQLQQDSRDGDNVLVDVMATHGRELCADPGRIGSVACAKYAINSSDADEHRDMTIPTMPTAGSKALRGTSAQYSQRLTWRSVIDAGRRHAKGKSKGPQTLVRSSLRGLEWQGKIPSVACVTVIPSDIANRSRLEYFIENFRSQTYEGPRKLMLVFNSAEFEVGQLVRSHADGKYIVAVGSWDGESFPSSRSFRYGAWGVSTDIVARWNFDEWHHPERLAMQVRALAVSSRPVSLLKRWTALEEQHAHGSSGFSQKILSGSVGWYGSIVGEASWMRDHWMPMMADEHSMLASVQSKGVVHVDMPELSVYNPGAPHRWNDVLEHFDMVKAPRITTVEVCFAVSNVTWASDTAIGDSEYVVHIQDKLRGEMGNAYDELATKRHLVAKTLRELCANADLVPNEREKERVLDNAARIAELHRNIQEPFNRVVALFRANQ